MCPIRKLSTGDHTPWSVTLRRLGIKLMDLGEQWQENGCRRIQHAILGGQR
jgi:hypothetical protein